MTGWMLWIGIATMAVLQACSRQDAHVVTRMNARPGAYRAPMRTLPWLADFKLGAAPAEHGALTRLTDEFLAGEPIYLSMKVNAVPRDTVVTTYWYGPGNNALAYETKAVPATDQRLRFVQDNTRDWRPGAYCAEVWIGDIKLKERHFEIVSGRSAT
jgi:hypothetical protein